MFGRASSAIILIASIMSPSPSSADVLQPTANWVVDYREDQCLATREYGTPQKPLTLGIRPAPNGETYEILVARPHSGPEFATELKGAVDFGNGSIKAWLLNYGGEKTKSSVYQFRISADEMAQASTAARATLKAEDASDLTFALFSMPTLLKTLRDCTRDLRQYWNADGAKNGLIATPSRGDVRAVFTSDDYPADAIERRQGGNSQYLLLIDEKGGVAGCHVLIPSGVPVLDAMGCQVIRKRAKFTPALDRQGKPVRSTYTTPPVAWRIGG